ncbi:formate C-acetyltransferase [Gemella haemolysans]|uniref:Formate acetyltransferase n=1 Tax=Gemella haemolysans ATCC 10379 TaxID=546270 RepID=C5NWS2_9BACL|nr:formate C-acetyltransferase [Gemella haemolysans]EER68259.1 formate C-acetyltransferase [Gemella haemolysans ATCC 10379]KAA8707522.1 formate C-acetyltransferase [Gemella haemolysans]UBH81768.1 formate C-acetyltransferase [Gemella haemolysans]VEI38323.1 Formate acetyltransferase [Gemella haemolysans]
MTTVAEKKAFVGGKWQTEVDLVDFIKSNYTEYRGDSSFLAGPTEATIKLVEKFNDLMRQERLAGGTLDMDTSIPSTILSHGPGYIEKDLEQIVGLQTEKPLKRALMTFGGINMAVNSCKAYGYEVDEEVIKIFTDYRKTHNQGVFDAYTPEMRLVRKSGVITGLPDAYGRGRIIGDYRRVALYGVDQLIAWKKEDLAKIGADGVMTEHVIRDREEVNEQIRALGELKEMAKIYGFDISEPATNAKEAVQWLYFGYLAAIKQQNGAAMSIGNIATFLDIYIERDLQDGTINESQAQELIDHLVLKLRCVKFARTPDYNQLFSGDPIWATLIVGEMLDAERSLVTKTDFRFIHTLDNMGNSPEPNLTILWSTKLPTGFKEYCSESSINHSAIQYESDELLADFLGTCDKSIACCVSGMTTGKDMQFFGARANLAKALLYTINGGRDEKLGIQVGPETEPLRGVLNYDEVWAKFDVFMEWLCKLYINTLNVIHYMHDKYSYESLEMALHDTKVRRFMATGIAGFSVAVDSLSAIKYAKVTPIEDETGLAVDYKVEGEFPTFGNNDDRADEIAVELLKVFMTKLKKHETYRADETTTSILTITSNVVYGKKTGNTPDGRRAGEPFSPGANPMNGRDQSGALACLSSVAKLPYEYSRDGISLTAAFTPSSLGKTKQDQIKNLTAMMDGYFKKGGYHLNTNVFNKETLLKVIESPEDYPNFTIRVSGYAVRLISLTPEQQRDVLSRTMHQFM